LLQSAFFQIGDFGSIVLLIVLIIIFAALSVYFIVWALLKKPVTGVESLKGELGVALTNLTGKDIGEVSIDGVIWKARINERGAGLPVSKGDSVIVVGVSALTLLVQRQEEK